MAVSPRLVVCLGVGIFLVTVASLFLPWWSVRAPGVEIDLYPFGVRAGSVPEYDRDWVVDELLSLGDWIWVVGLLVVVSCVLALAGVLRYRVLLPTPFVLNLSAGVLFHGLVRSSIGELAYGCFSGTNLTPEGPWGFGIGIALCVLAGVASLIPLILIRNHWLASGPAERAGTRA